MQTIIKEIEAVVNQHPLVYVGDDLDSSIVITPGHFLCLNPRTGIPEIENEDEWDPTFRPVESSAEKLLKLWKKGEKILNSFWKFWQGEYLLSLRKRTQKAIKSRKPEADEFPQTGDVVLIKEDLPHGQWKLGKLNRLRVSRNGQIRSAEVITASGRNLNRPLNLLYPKEVQSESVKHERKQGSEDSESTGSSGFTVKRPKRKAAEVATDLLKRMM
ncbi:uncharacterized protein LOC123537090 [Mercenaria mercenaria]|uniref:uncharacterized protein LOC123537090 n=1 Tax=Mercenaria mercenaria TaxID=6596 RepID=UPI00234F29F1|nr:uncharacterized protein LOC123537090 [Mercenaria mercenaria]